MNDAVTKTLPRSRKRVDNLHGGSGAFIPEDDGIGTGAAPSLLRRAAAGAARRARRLLPRGTRPVILMYHRVADEPFDPWSLAVSPERFRQQLAWLSEGRQVLPLTEFAARHRQQTLPSNAAALTFDDGYACVAHAARPALEQARLPATVFLPVALVEQGRPFWWDELQAILLSADAETIEVDAKIVRIGEKNPDDRRWAPGARPRTRRQKAFLSIWAMLRERAPRELGAAMDQLRRQVPRGAEQNNARPMTPAEVREVASERISFGSHALTHPWLTSLERAAKSREIRGSVDRFTEIVGVPPTSFAYPYGAYDEESVQLVREAGFACACTTVNEPVGARASPFKLPRMQVGNWPAEELAHQIAAL